MALHSCEKQSNHPDARPGCKHYCGIRVPYLDAHSHGIVWLIVSLVCRKADSLQTFVRVEFYKLRKKESVQVLSFCLGGGAFTGVLPCAALESGEKSQDHRA